MHHFRQMNPAVAQDNRSPLTYSSADSTATIGMQTLRTRACAITIIIVVTMLSTTLLRPIFGQETSSVFEDLRARAHSAREAGDTRQATDLYAQAVQINPSWPDGWWFLGTLEYGADQYAQAQQALTHFIDLQPDAAPALALRGLCEFEEARYSEALQDLQSGIAKGAANQPKNAQILLYHEALLLTRLGRFDEATGKYLALVPKAVPNPELELAIGITALHLPLLPKDLDSSQLELAGSIGEAAIPVMMGNLYQGQQQFQQLFTRYSTTPNIHYFYGYLLFAAHSDDAASQFQQEVAITPHNAVALAMLAWCASFEGDYLIALPAAERAVSEDPSLPMAQLMYGRALVETGQVDAGLPHIQKVLNQDPQNLEAHLTLAKAYSKAGQADEARKERQICLQMTAGGTGAHP